MNSDPVLAWQARNLPVLKKWPFEKPCSSDVTLLTYWLWSDERFDLLLDSLLAAILMTWKCCGRIPVVLVVNRLTVSLQTMAEQWGVKLIFEPHMKGGGGNVRDLNRDVILNLASRFETEYVLTFQNHAFPIRSGLEKFLGSYDYIGAPWVFGKDDLITRILLRHRYDVGNGAFTLRSRKLCETTAWYFEKKYKFLPHCYLVIDDYFIGKTLPSFERHYRETIRIALPEAAATFSLEDNVDLHTAMNARPFGFHGLAAFECLYKEGQITELTEKAD